MYDTIRRLLATAVDKIRTQTTEDSVYVPPSIIKDDDSLIQFIHDNLTFLWSSLKGKSTHIVRLAMVQTSELSKGTQSKVTVSSKHQRNRSAECLPKGKLEIKRQGSKILRKTIIEKELLPINLFLETPKGIRHLDKEIMLARKCPTQLMATEECPSSLPSYRTICSKLSKENVHKSNVFNLSFLYKAPNNHATVEKSRRTFMVISKTIASDDTVVTQDLFIYQIAQGVKIKAQMISKT